MRQPRVLPIFWNLLPDHSCSRPPTYLQGCTLLWLPPSETSEKPSTPNMKILLK